jgi:hypothetical protein
LPAYTSKSIMMVTHLYNHRLRICNFPLCVCSVNRTKGYKSLIDSIYFQPEPYLSKILAQDPTPDPVNARVSAALDVLPWLHGRLVQAAAIC